MLHSKKGIFIRATKNLLKTPQGLIVNHHCARQSYHYRLCSQGHKLLYLEQLTDNAQFTHQRSLIGRNIVVSNLGNFGSKCLLLLGSYRRADMSLKFSTWFNHTFFVGFKCPMTWFKTRISVLNSPRSNLKWSFACWNQNTCITRYRFGSQEVKKICVILQFSWA